mgnify:CR=1 FL=1
MNIDIKDLKTINGTNNWYKEHGEGYRIVYLYENNYKVGAYAKNIQDFMIDFSISNPIESESDIPEFISIEDLLNRYLADLKEITGVALYKTDGTLIMKKMQKDITNDIKKM